MYLAIVDPIEAIFDVCDVNGDDGLTLVEVQKDDCMKPLEKLFGLTKLTMTKAFLKIDTNGDHIITKEEGHTANKNLDRGADYSKCESHELDQTWECLQFY